MSKTTRATQSLEKLGVKFTLHLYAYDPDAASIGLQAAEALGVPPARVLKTLMAEVDGKPVCAVVPSDCEVSMKKLAGAFGAKTAKMMRPADAERLTGYHVGGISPFGQKKRVPVAIEAAASFFMLTSQSDGTTAQTGLPSASAINVLSTRSGGTPSASAACSPMLAASGS